MFMQVARPPTAGFHCGCFSAMTQMVAPQNLAALPQRPRSAASPLLLQQRC
jgi:hypothetical protein